MGQFEHGGSLAIFRLCMSSRGLDLTRRLQGPVGAAVSRCIATTALGEKKWDGHWLGSRTG